jgi:single-strand DNA-binding protein
MPDFSSVVLVGRLVRDPELRYTADGSPVANFTVAVNHRFTKADGQKSDEAAFVDVTAWARLGEVVAQFLKKGRAALVQGRIAQDRWQDPKTGQKRSKFHVVAAQVQFLDGGSKDDEPSAEPGSDAPAEEPEAVPAPAPAAGPVTPKPPAPRARR